MNELMKEFESLIRGSPDLSAVLRVQELTPASRLQEDLGFDSILLIAFLCDLQEKHPHLSEEDLATWRTLGDCADSILKGAKA